VGSLLVSYWVYDHSELCRWEWIRGLFPVAPRRWANIHVGLGETSLTLRRLFPDTQSTILDIYDAGEMTEPSIRRARRLTPAPVAAAHAEASALPFADQELDAVFLLARLIVQWFVYGSRLWKGNLFNTRVHLLFSVRWIYYVVIFGWALWRQLRAG